MNPLSPSFFHRRANKLSKLLGVAAVTLYEDLVVDCMNEMRI